MCKYRILEVFSPKELIVFPGGMCLVEQDDNKQLPSVGTNFSGSFPTFCILDIILSSACLYVKRMFMKCCHPPGVMLYVSEEFFK